MVAQDFCRCFGSGPESWRGPAGSLSVTTTAIRGWPPGATFWDCRDVHNTTFLYMALALFCRPNSLNQGCQTCNEHNFWRQIWKFGGLALSIKKQRSAQMPWLSIPQTFCTLWLYTRCDGVLSAWFIMSRSLNERHSTATRCLSSSDDTVHNGCPIAHHGMHHSHAKALSC